MDLTFVSLPMWMNITAIAVVFLAVAVKIIDEFLSVDKHKEAISFSTVALVVLVAAFIALGIYVCTAITPTQIFWIVFAVVESIVLFVGILLGSLTMEETDDFLRSSISVGTILVIGASLIAGVFVSVGIFVTQLILLVIIMILLCCGNWDD